MTVAERGGSRTQGCVFITAGPSTKLFACGGWVDGGRDGTERDASSEPSGDRIGFGAGMGQVLGHETYTGRARGGRRSGRRRHG